MAYRLLLLGPARLVDETGAGLAFPSKGLLLAARAVLSRDAGTISRISAANHLWEDTGPRHAAMNMRQLLTRLRARQAELGLGLFTFETRQIRVDPSGVTVDLVEFLQATGTGAPASLKRLCELYRGDLLSDVDIAGEQCRGEVETDRSRLRHLFVETVGAGLARPVTPQTAHETREAARCLLAIDPYNEIACRALMRALRLDGHAAQAGEVYDRFRSRLATDLGVEPSAATTFLAHHPPGSANLPRASSPSFAVSEGASQRRRPDPIALPRLTILPPILACGHGELGELAHALLDDVTIGLCSLRSIGIVAPHTAWQIGAAPDPVPFISRFAIDYVVESRLAARLGQLSLFVQLIATPSRTVLWAEKFAFSEGDVAAHYRDLTRRITRALAEGVERRETARFDGDTSPGAYARFLIGQRHVESLDLPSIRRARKAFQSTLADHPTFAPALSGMARSYHLEWLLLARRDPAHLHLSIELAARAVALSPEDARGYRELGVASLFARRYDESIDALSHGEATSPQFADLLTDLADTLSHSSSPSLGLAKIETAIELNPLAPDGYWWTAGGTNYLLGRYEAALACLLKMRDSKPADRLIAATYGMLGAKDQARKYVRRVKAEHPDFRVDDWLDIVPFREPAKREHYEQGLRAAGFA